MLDNKAIRIRAGPLEMVFKDMLLPSDTTPAQTIQNTERRSSSVMSSSVVIVSMSLSPVVSDIDFTFHRYFQPESLGGFPESLVDFLREYLYQVLAHFALKFVMNAKYE